jgi:hypothetical protein
MKTSLEFLADFGELIRHVNERLAGQVLGFQFQPKMQHFMVELLMSGAHQIKEHNSF